MQRHQVLRICLSEPDRVFKNCFSHLLCLGLLRCRKDEIQYQRNVDAFSGSVRVQIVQEITKLCIFKRFEYVQSPIKLWQCPIITIHVPLMKSSSKKHYLLHFQESLTGVADHLVEAIIVTVTCLPGTLLP